MRRLALTLVLIVVVVAPACARSPSGPAEPVAEEQVGGPDGVDIAAARTTALDFLSDYAESPKRGIGPLRRLVAGPDLRSWVRWLGVQNHEFDGTIDGSVALRSAAFASLVPLRTSLRATVDIGASVTFSYSPSSGDPFERTRILDGPMTLERMGTAEWKVVDVTRDGVSMDAGITRFTRQTRRVAGVSVTLDSVFRFVPNWQFNLVVTNDSPATVGLDPTMAALIVKGPQDLQAIQTVPTQSLRQIRPGARVEALVAVPFQDSARGRALSLPFLGSDGRLRRFVFPLAGLIDAAPSRQTDSPSPG